MSVTMIPAVYTDYVDRGFELLHTNGGFLWRLKFSFLLCVYPSMPLRLEISPLENCVVFHALSADHNTFGKISTNGYFSISFSLFLLLNMLQKSLSLYIRIYICWVFLKDTFLEVDLLC